MRFDINKETDYRMDGQADKSNNILFSLQEGGDQLVGFSI